jgi:hypothetical protein
MDRGSGVRLKFGVTPLIYYMEGVKGAMFMGKARRWRLPALLSGVTGEGYR